MNIAKSMAQSIGHANNVTNSKKMIDWVNHFEGLCEKDPGIPLMHPAELQELYYCWNSSRKQVDKAAETFKGKFASNKNGDENLYWMFLCGWFLANVQRIPSDGELVYFLQWFGITTQTSMFT